MAYFLTVVLHMCHISVVYLPMPTSLTKQQWKLLRANTINAQIDNFIINLEKLPFACLGKTSRKQMISGIANLGIARKKTISFY